MQPGPRPLPEDGAAELDGAADPDGAGCAAAGCGAEDAADSAEAGAAAGAAVGDSAAPQANSATRVRDRIKRTTAFRVKQVAIHTSEY